MKDKKVDGQKKNTGSGKILVNLDDLEYVCRELFSMQIQSAGPLGEKAKALKGFIEDKVIDESRRLKNEFKREIHYKRTHASSAEESTYFHRLYQEIDSIFDTSQKASDKSDSVTPKED